MIFFSRLSHKLLEFCNCVFMFLDNDALILVFFVCEVVLEIYGAKHWSALLRLLFKLDQL